MLVSTDMTYAKNYMSVRCQTHYNVTDNNNVIVIVNDISFECLNNLSLAPLICHDVADLKKSHYGLHVTVQSNCRLGDNESIKNFN